MDMDRVTFKHCVDVEVDHWAIKGNVPLFRKIWFRYIQPESNAVYLIRKYQYFCFKQKNSRLAHLRARLLSTKLMRRYSIFIGESCIIDLGFKIWHPYGIIINNVTIGKNFQIQHNCTIGTKDTGKDGKGIGYKEVVPVIGNNVCMYAGSYILGPIKVTDNVIIGANTVVIKDILNSGTYVGSPARKVR